jgi:hypothetical protein
MAKYAKVLKTRVHPELVNDTVSAPSDEEVSQALIDLESLLTDIDNARDFHTIQAWPILLGDLSLLVS